MTTTASLRTLTCMIHTSFVGLFAMAASYWVLAETARGDALLWTTWLTVLAAAVALPASILVARRCFDELPVPRHLADRPSRCV